MFASPDNVLQIGLFYHWLHTVLFASAGIDSIDGALIIISGFRCHVVMRIIGAHDGVGPTLYRAALASIIQVRFS